MFYKSQEEIQKDWKQFDRLQVSIRCITYNHAPYIANALDSFLMQETNFPFEIVVHDDASTDGTADIIREYEKKYPKIIKPIYETENQYSKKDGSLKKILDEVCVGKYTAMCEGDDYWCDSKKIQKQYDFLETNPDYSACAHNTKIINLDNNSERTMFPIEDKIITLSDSSGFCHVSSLMFRTDFYSKWPKFMDDSKAPGDIKLNAILKINGPILRYGKVMSVYRYGVPGSWQKRRLANKNVSLDNSKNVLDFYKELEIWAPNDLKEFVKKLIEKQQFLIYCKTYDIKRARTEYPCYWKSLSLKRKLYYTYRFFVKKIV